MSNLFGFPVTESPYMSADIDMICVRKGQVEKLKLVLKQENEIAEQIAAARVADAERIARAEGRAEMATRGLESVALRIERLLNVARGCTDYGGGHTGAAYEAFQHGIQTVVSALEAAAKNDPSDFQVNTLERIGAALAPPSQQEAVDV